MTLPRRAPQPPSITNNNAPDAVCACSSACTAAVIIHYYQASAPSRIVNTASNAEHMGAAIDWNDLAAGPAKVSVIINFCRTTCRVPI